MGRNDGDAQERGRVMLLMVVNWGRREIRGDQRVDELGIDGSQLGDQQIAAIFSFCFGHLVSNLDELVQFVLAFFEDRVDIDRNGSLRLSDGLLRWRSNEFGLFRFWIWSRC